MAKRNKLSQSPDKQNKLPFISVIIPLYNKEKYVESTIRSVLSQSVSSFEIIVIDDGSTDHSNKIVAKIDDSRIRLYEKPNGGVSSARNLGIEKAKGQFIFFLDADDEILNNCFEIFRKLHTKYPEHKIFTSNFIYKDASTSYPYCRKTKEGLVKSVFFQTYLKNIYLRTGNFIVKRELIQGKHEFNESISINEDFDFTCRIIKGQKIIYNPEIVFVYKREHAELSVSTDNKKEHFISIAKIKGTFSQKLLYAQYIIKYYKGFYGTIRNDSSYTLNELFFLFLSVFIERCTNFYKKLIGNR